MVFQIEVLNILDSFRIIDVHDYYKLPHGDKLYFINRLYKAFKKSNKDLYNSLQETGGVKFLFETTGSLHSNISNLPTETFLKKLNFYSNQTLITFPFYRIPDHEKEKINKKISTLDSIKSNYKDLIFGEISSRSTSDGSILEIRGEAYTIDPILFKEFLDVITKLRPAIEAGMTYITPDFSKKGIFSQEKHGVLSANFQHEELLRQFQEKSFANKTKSNKRNDFGISNLFLPYFTDIPIERIIEIRENEADLYADMQRKLSNLLYNSSQIDSELILYNYMKDVDNGVRELNQKFHSIKENYKRKNIYMSIKLIAASLVLLAPLEASSIITSLLGGSTAFEFITALEENQTKKLELSDNQFYLPWKLLKNN